MAKGGRGIHGIASRWFRPTPYYLPSYSILHRRSKIIAPKYSSKIGKMLLVPYALSVLIMLFFSSVPLMIKAAVPTCVEPPSTIRTAWTSTRRQTQKDQVKGWTVVEPSRDHLNAKEQTCNQDNCSFIGTYNELQKHVKTEHPSAKPHEVDPTLEQKWRNLEQEQEREDVMGTIRSSNPGALFLGDYVIERSHFGLGSDSDADALEPNKEFEN